jgi:hypothetical protein
MLTVAACGEQREATPPTAAAPPAAPAPPTPATTLTLLEPIDGAMGGHIDTFRWSPLEGADGYVIRIVAVTGNRLVWESAPMTETETRLPATVALEPEAHSWSVSARRGTDVLATSPTQKFTITP